MFRKFWNLYFVIRGGYDDKEFEIEIAIWKVALLTTALMVFAVLTAPLYFVAAFLSLMLAVLVMGWKRGSDD